MRRIAEDTRSQLVNLSRKAKTEKDGRTRYEKRKGSSVSNSVKSYNSINMNSLFKEDILTVNIEVKGETDNYTTTVSFGDFLEKLHRRLESAGTLSLKVVIQSLVDAFNGSNVFVRCSCPDFFYRFGYWLSKDSIIYGERQNIPSDITNPTNDLGKGCKHVMLVLANHSWLLKVASVVWNYINYMEKHYEKMYQTVIYPAIYGKDYEEVQLDIFDDSEMPTEKQDLNTSNEYGRKRTQFSKGNAYRFQPSSKDADQLSIDVEET